MSPPAVDQGPRYAKGFCGGNDFVLLIDPDDDVRLTGNAVRGLCDRYRGLGGDGVLRLVRTEFADPALAGDAEWFMDCRNPDGTVAPMCGPGLGLIARYLLDAGLIAPGEVWIGTSVGAKRTVIDDRGTTSIELLPPEFLGSSSVRLGGREYPGSVISLGNLHLVCFVTTPVEALDLSAEPVLAGPGFGDADLDITWVNVLADGRLRTRVYEPGTGEMRSCGTAVCAAAAARQRAEGAWGTTVVDTDAGPLSVTLRGHGKTVFTGAASVAALGTLDATWITSLDKEPS
ncbi:Diaminopimelate epimerase (EC [Amycolatopsis camponoti]|uniref:Diaminopimelate epimerase (EC) n=1 Tax=Amycolatopsis camponoti TaxID=2606593 RepID=A0A6I8LUC5_9PSEU|nr:diaminopimelate epimerase [Amycolatopsis camponoti]VVJ20732.1 Diaminopimelate epimerase (EC [Amycolatopsis camponoti]